MAQYFFPCLFLVPDSNITDNHGDVFGLLIRKWQVSMFDLATLEVNHTLHMRYELMNVFLSRCNLEFVISADSLGEAKDRVLSLRASMYIQGIAPFLIPFVSTHSINEIAGINSRDSEYLREKLPDAMKLGLTTKTGKVEAWPFELSFQVVSIGERRLTQSVFLSACSMAERWDALLKQHPPLKAVP